MTAGKAKSVRAKRGAGRAGTDPRLVELERSLGGLREALEQYAAPLTDRAVAERELALLEAMVRAARPEEAALRQGLLLLASAVGSVRALAPALAEVRAAVDLFGPPLAARQRITTR